MTKPRLFKNETLQNEFDENGFVKFRMFSAEQLESLHQFYTETRQEHESVTDQKKFHATNDTDDADLIGRADTFIKEVMSDEIHKHFYNYKTIAANYLLKQCSPDSVLPPHQDLRFVDEEKYYSFNIWVPTKATNRSNGGLRFLKGSHRMHNTVRALPCYPWKYEKVITDIERYMTDVDTEPGECIILNHACIHASYPNLSKEVRIAAILALIPQEADIIHYFLPDGNPQNMVEQYAMTIEDFIHLKVGHRPDNAVLLKKFQYDFRQIERPEFLEWLKMNNYHTDSLTDNMEPVPILIETGNRKKKKNSLYEYIKRQLSPLLG